MEVLTKSKDVQCAECGYTGPPKLELATADGKPAYTVDVCPKCGSADLVEPIAY